MQAAPRAHRALPVRIGRTSHRNHAVSAIIAAFLVPGCAIGGRACQSHPVTTGQPCRHGWGGHVREIERSARSSQQLLCLDAHLAVGRATGRAGCPPGRPAGTEGWRRLTEIAQSARPLQLSVRLDACTWMCHFWPGVQVAPGAHRAARPAWKERASHGSRTVSTIVAPCLVPGCAIGGRACRSRPAPTGPPFRCGWGGRLTEIARSARPLQTLVYLHIRLVAGHASRTPFPLGCPSGTDGADVSQTARGQRDHCTMSCAWMCIGWPGVRSRTPCTPGCPSGTDGADLSQKSRCQRDHCNISCAWMHTRRSGAQQIAPGAHRAALPVRTGRTSYRNRAVSATIAHFRAPGRANVGRACKSHPVPPGPPFRYGWGGRRTEIARSARPLHIIVCLRARVVAGRATNRTRRLPGRCSGTDGVEVSQRSPGQRATIENFHLPGSATGGRACNKSRPLPTGPPFRQAWGGRPAEFARRRCTRFCSGRHRGTNASTRDPT